MALTGAGWRVQNYDISAAASRALPSASVDRDEQPLTVCLILLIPSPCLPHHATHLGSADLLHRKLAATAEAAMAGAPASSPTVPAPASAPAAGPGPAPARNGSTLRTETNLFQGGWEFLEDGVQQVLGGCT